MGPTKMGLMMEPMVMITKLLRSQNGLTLIEVIATLPVALMITLGVGAALIAMTTLGLGTRKNADTQSEAVRLGSEIRHLTQFAMNVRLANGSLNGSTSPSGEGFVRTWSYRQFSDATSPNTVLMFFNREARPSRNTANGGLTSQQQPIAVFFREPTPRTPGAILVNYGRPGGGAQNLLPSQAQLRFESLVGVSLRDPVVSQGQILERISFHFTTRNFLASDQRPQHWCPRQDVATNAICRNGASYRDTERIFTLKFDNNARYSPSTPAFEFPTGLFLFRPRGRVLDDL